jgi:hypothetical protein
LQCGLLRSNFSFAMAQAPFSFVRMVGESPPYGGG